MANKISMAEKHLATLEKEYDEINIKEEQRLIGENNTKNIILNKDNSFHNDKK